MKKAMTYFSIFVLICLIGYFSHLQHNKNSFISASAPAVKNISIRTERAIRYETGEESVTYKEVFERLEAHINESESKIIELKSIANDSNRKHADATIKYLQSCQEFLRAQLNLNRKQLALSVAIESLSDSVSDMRANLGTYSFKYMEKAFNRAVKEADKATEETEEARILLFKAINNLAETTRSVSDLLPTDTLVSQAQIEKLIITLKPKKEEAPKNDGVAPKNLEQSGRKGG